MDNCGCSTFHRLQQPEWTSSHCRKNWTSVSNSDRREKQEYVRFVRSSTRNALVVTELRGRRADSRNNNPVRWERIPARQSERRNQNDHPELPDPLRKLNRVWNAKSTPGWTEEDRNAGPDQHTRVELREATEWRGGSGTLDRGDGTQRRAGPRERGEGPQESGGVPERNHPRTERRAWAHPLHS